MAATIARATGYDRSRVKETHRLGSERSSATAATWHTDARATVNADGSGSLTLTRDGATVATLTFGPESGDAAHIATLSVGPGATVIRGTVSAADAATLR